RNALESQRESSPPPVETAASSLPSDQRGGPGQPGAERPQHHERTLLDAALPNGLVQRNRNRCCRRIAIAVQIKHDFFKRQLKSISHRLEDAHVGLMRYIEVEVGD